MEEEEEQQEARAPACGWEKLCQECKPSAGRCTRSCCCCCCRRLSSVPGPGSGRAERRPAKGKHVRGGGVGGCLGSRTGGSHAATSGLGVPLASESALGRLEPGPPNSLRISVTLGQAPRAAPSAASSAAPGETHPSRAPAASSSRRGASKRRESWRTEAPAHPVRVCPPPLLGQASSSQITGGVKSQVTGSPKPVLDLEVSSWGLWLRSPVDGEGRCSRTQAGPLPKGKLPPSDWPGCFPCLQTPPTPAPSAKSSEETFLGWGRRALATLCGDFEARPPPHVPGNLQITPFPWAPGACSAKGKEDNSDTPGVLVTQPGRGLEPPGQEGLVVTVTASDGLQVPITEKDV
uniref:Uncharacterized protein n=1 Tax=Oryctolagus cuniculus TaxID=9986 RepID=A0A5F9DTW6_RABIT